MSLLTLPDVMSPVPTAVFCSATLLQRADLDTSASEAREQLVRAFPDHCLQINQYDADAPFFECGYSRPRKGFSGEYPWISLGAGDTADEAVVKAAQSLRPRSLHGDRPHARAAMQETTALTLAEELELVLEVCAAAMCVHCAGRDPQVKPGEINTATVVAPSGLVDWHEYAEGGFARICGASDMRRRAQAWIAMRAEQCGEAKS